MPVTYKVKQGDTLNDIAKKYGFNNYKEAGISSVPSGNFDLIRPNETITIGNAKAGVGDINSNPIITSQDVQSQFKQDSSTLDSIINAPKLEDPNATDPNADPNKTKDTTDPSGVGDGIYNAYRKSADEAKNKANEEADGVLKEYDSLYKLELASIDAKTRSTVDSLKLSFAQRIEEQKRINQVNVDRVKAYGLSSGNAMYTPIAWTDAISERERKAADEITGLEKERQNLIDAAKAAQQESNAALLAQKIKDYNAVKDKLNTRLSEIEADSKAQYEELRKLRQEAEDDFKAKQQESLKRLQAYYQLNPDEITNLSDEEKSALVEQIAGKYGFQNYEVLAALDAATAPNFEALKSQAEIDRIKAQTASSYASAGASSASAAASYALAAQRKKQTEQIGSDEGGDFSDQEKRKLEQAGLGSAPRQDQLDYLYGDEFTKQDIVDKYGGAGTSSGVGDTQSRAEAAGYDYEGMKAAGYSDDDIKSALDAAGV